MYIDDELRKTISGKFFDMGNLCWVGLCFSAIFSNLQNKWILFVAGISLGLIFYLFGILINKSGGKK